MTMPTLRYLLLQIRNAGDPMAAQEVRVLRALRSVAKRRRLLSSTC